MNLVLNVSTHPGDLALLDDDWDSARALLDESGFHGYELYPVEPYDFSRIPADLVAGIHLRFFAIVEPLWNGRRDRLLEIFGDLETVEQFYGGTTRDAIVETYRRQLALAHEFGCEYVVFHAANCELEYLFDWQVPWSCGETLDLCAEVMNEVTRDTPYEGWILFENLWWPGSFRLDSPTEIDRLLSRAAYPRCGLCLDTGHILNRNQSLRTEGQAIDYLLESVQTLGSLTETIRVVHMARSLSTDYVLESRKLTDPYADCATFWDRLDVALRHAESIDQHEAFEDPRISRLLDVVSPDNLVFEFSYRSLDEWRQKIATQKLALSLP